MADTDPVVDSTVDDEIEEDIPEPVSHQGRHLVAAGHIYHSLFRLQFH